MKSADEEIAIKVTNKLQETGQWSNNFINKFASFIKDGKVSSSDIIFLVETQRDENCENKETKK
ncbi:hypothetical protein LQZ21_03490 [Treponema sp. TIM-1]|uniref:hypothetical protein n=1 Tax=Treponema sp. TIM-1 TaxID=2898417 RepID=UPI00397E92C8